MRFQRPASPGFPIARYNYGDRFAGNHPQYRPQYVSPDRGRDRFRSRRREFSYWYGSVYPGWVGYPYELNPGFLDWGDDENSSNDQGSVALSQPDPYLEPDYGIRDPYAGPDEPEDSASTDQPESEPQLQQPLVVVFKDGRAPETIENYIMTTTVLTNFDARHYERIPLSQIDLVATQQANRANGINFQIPNNQGD